VPVRRGEIYWIDFGIPRGSEQGGKRPALIIQNDAGNDSSPTTIIAAITGKKKKSYPFHVEISASESGLSYEGCVMLEQVLTISQDRLIDRAGRLSDAKMRMVDRAIQVSLGLPRLQGT
jgi:mRNA interferase MazF